MHGGADEPVFSSRRASPPGHTDGQQAQHAEVSVFPGTSAGTLGKEVFSFHWGIDVRKVEACRLALTRLEYLCQNMGGDCLTMKPTLRRASEITSSDYFL